MINNFSARGLRRFIARFTGAKPHPMDQFHNLLGRIMRDGSLRPNRTAERTKFVPGAMMEFDMADGYPAITTRKLAFKAACGELFGFFRGYDSAAQFRSINCKVWDGNANETPSWVNNPARKGTDDLGRIYGAQWTDWTDMRVVPASEEAQWLAKGFKVLTRGVDEATGTAALTIRRGINQLEDALREILMNPTNRRIIVNGWRPDEHDRGALPVCHVAYQFLVDPEKKELHMTLWQRSFDSPTAFNVPLGALFLMIMARLAGLTPRKFVHFISDAHIYECHFDGVEKLLKRDHLPQPKLVLSDNIKPVTVDEIPGVFTRINPEDISLEGYQHHPPIKFQMVA